MVTERERRVAVLLELVGLLVLHAAHTIQYSTRVYSYSDAYIRADTLRYATPDATPRHATPRQCRTSVLIGTERNGTERSGERIAQLDAARRDATRNARRSGICDAMTASASDCDCDTSTLRT